VIVADVSHTVLSDQSVYLEPDYPPEQAAGLVRDLIAKAYADQWQSPEGLLGVGISVGAPVHPVNGQVLRGGLPNWTGIDLRQLFGPMFEAPIFADNESNCSAIAEMTWGAAQGFEDFIVYTLDLGVGGAIVSGGKVLRGIAGGAGEFGHVVIDPTGPLCRCGNRGCIEVYASFREPLAEAEKHFGRSLRITDVVTHALAGSIQIGRVACWPAVKVVTITSSKDSAKASMPPATSAVPILGRITWRKVWKPSAPRSIDASTSDPEVRRKRAMALL
jgi:predicted NBD/HSP70 family sugar kinase